MKKYLVLIAISAMVIISVGFSEIYDGEDIEGICEELLSKRSLAWGKIFEDGYDLNKFEKDIREIECGTLLTEDIGAFLSLQDSPLDLERATVLKFISEEKKEIYQGYCVKGQVFWHIETQDGEELLSLKYRIELIKNGDSYYLTSLNFIG